MTGPVPVPVDVVELVVRVLRRLLAEHPDTVTIKVSTETGRGHDGGPPSLPWLLITEDTHTWAWPALQRSVVRLTCWHRTDHAAKATLNHVMGLLCARPAPAPLLHTEPVSAPLTGDDPYTRAPLATAAIAVHARTPTT
ncbi:hypothetical protein [Actinokineospora iranica]|uniref:DUF3168 domain-containing protein n=1 Tax=Actinokineospora iranica TaxID=1271860 RepID=A0A1G6K452_9PSEU|nr:hypothetical protein [Actinokineospora iranica]SDC25770.1 hypothetical protein SAMN05216174_101707 [Actinokineospora iranica]